MRHVLAVHRPVLFLCLCGERRRSSGEFGSTEPVLKMFGIVWVLDRFLLLVDF